MARFLVAGALDLSQKNSQELVRCLGEEIIDQGHDLLNGCRNELDRLVAQSAFGRLTEKGLGLNKPVVVTAFKGTTLPFDVADIPTIFWEGQKQLKDKLRERVALIASSQGR